MAYHTTKVFAAASFLAIHISSFAEPVEYTGMCDASAATLIDKDKFVVANDEDNVLRVYSLTKPGPPVATKDISTNLEAKKEADIEGAARIGNRIYWITSHGANKNGKPRPDRRRFFATDIITDTEGPGLKLFGTPSHALDTLFQHSIGVRYSLEAASQRAPESENALNIEGLAPTPDGRLYIGFRNPIPHGRALIVPLNNPDKLLSPRQDEKATPQFGDAIELDLGGLGIRSIELVPHTSNYVISAGAAGSGQFAMFGWRPGAKPVRLKIAIPEDFRPEALMIDQDGQTLYLLSDDGDACKNPPTFRLMSVPLPKW